MADTYFADDKPSVRGGPAATGDKPQDTLKKQAGPLPVYGWIIVAVVGVFLWRRLNGSGKGKGTDAGAVMAAPNSMGWGAPFPGSGAGGAGGSTAGSGDTVPAQLAVDQLKKATDPYTPKASNADLSNFYAGTFEKTPVADRPALANFFADNAAKKNLGLPYMTGVFSPHGYAQQLDPATGMTRYLDPRTGGSAPNSVWQK